MLHTAQKQKYSQQAAIYSKHMTPPKMCDPDVMTKTDSEWKFILMVNNVHFHFPVVLHMFVGVAFSLKS